VRWQEAETRLPAEEAALQTDRLVALSYRGIPRGWGLLWSQGTYGY
jgi:hypothetical protein